MKYKIFIFFFSLIKLNTINAQNYCAMVQLQDERYAYIDTLGKITYVQRSDITEDEHLFPFNEGIGRTRHHELFTFIDANGKSVFGVDYEKAEDFNEGYAEVKVLGKWGFINTKGQMVIEPKFINFHHRFSGGLSVFSQNGYHGYMNTKGEVVIKPQFDRVCHFRDNKAWVLKNGKWGCANKLGYLIIPPIYSDTKDFSEGYAWVKKDNLWGMIDSLGNYLIPLNDRNPLIYSKNPSLKNFYDFHNGLMIFKNNHKYGYCNHSLSRTIPAIFENALDFENGKACVKINGLWGVIDTLGNYIIKPHFQNIKLSSNNIYPAENKNDLWGYINQNDEWVIIPQFKEAFRFESTLKQ